MVIDFAVHPALSDEQAAHDLLLLVRLGNPKRCFECKSVASSNTTGPYQMTMRETTTGGLDEVNRWRCRSCGKQLSMAYDTPLAHRRMPISAQLSCLLLLCEPDETERTAAALDIITKFETTPTAIDFLLTRVANALYSTEEPGTSFVRGLYAELKATPSDEAVLHYIDPKRKRPSRVAVLRLPARPAPPSIAAVSVPTEPPRATVGFTVRAAVATKPALIQNGVADPEGDWEIAVPGGKFFGEIVCRSLTQLPKLIQEAVTNGWVKRRKITIE